MIDIQDFLFKIYTQKSNTLSNLDFNNLDKNSDSSDTTQKNVFEFNQDKSLNHDDSLSNSEQIAFAKQNIQNNVGNCTTSLKKTNDNTNKSTKTKKEKDNIQIDRKRGRERSKNTKKVHTKKYKDNLRYKIKTLLMKSLIKFINNKIDKKYKTGKKYQGQLLILKKSNQKVSIATYGQLFQKTISEYFSQDITNRNKTCLNDHNKQLIYSLLNDSDEEKKKFFSELFNTKLINCLQKFRGKKDPDLDYLDGLETFDEIKIQLGEDKDYIKKLTKCLEEFEDDIRVKK